jgi:hypothetical protein
MINDNNITTQIHKNVSHMVNENKITTQIQKNVSHMVQLSINLTL